MSRIKPPKYDWLDETLRQFEVGMLEIVGDEFAPKQPDGSPERQRLMGLIPQILPLQIAARESIQDAIAALETEGADGRIEELERLLDNASKLKSGGLVIDSDYVHGRLRALKRVLPREDQDGGDHAAN